MSSVVQKVEEAITPALTEMGYNTVKLSLYNSGKTKTLQLMMEKISGEPVGIADCEIVSKEISVLLDVSNLIKTGYNLEVSSAGINRPLVKIADYVRFCGSKILAKTYVAKEKRKIFIGKLVHADENKITIELIEPLHNGAQQIDLFYDEISSARLDQEIKFK